MFGITELIGLIRHTRKRRTQLRGRLHRAVPGSAIVAEELETRALLASVISLAETVMSTTEDAGTHTVTVVRSNDINTTASVSYTTVDGTAFQDEDYSLGQGAVQFAAGETSKTFSITILDDAELEAQEVFEIRLLYPSNATVGNGLGSITIVDNETIPETELLRPTDALAENQRTSTTGSAANTINNSGFVSGAQLDENPRDHYQSDIWYVNPLIQGTTTNPPEVLYYDLGSVQNVAEVYFWTQNDSPDMGAPTSLSVDYLGSSANPAFTVSGLSGQAWQSAVSSVGVSEDVHIAQVLRFADAVDTRFIRLTIEGATTGSTGAFGFNEFAVGVTSDASSGAAGPGEVGLAHSAVTVEEYDNNAAVTISRVNGSQGAITIDFTTVDQTATAGADYIATSGTVTLADGQTAATILVPLLDDGINEGYETFGLSLDSVTGGAFLGQPRTAIVTITDDESSGSSSDDAIAVYNFDDRTATDFGGTSNGFFVNGAGSITDTQRGLVAEFDGQNDRVLIPNDLAFNTTRLTLAAWIRPDSFGQGEGIISYGQDSSPWAMEVSASGRLQFAANRQNPVGASGSGTWTSNSVLLAGTWTHVAVTVNQSLVRFYINGELDRTISTTLTLGSSSENVWLGTDILSEDGHFDGLIDDARIFNRAISDADIAEIVAETSVSTYGSETLVSGLVQPTAIDFAPDGRMFIAEKAGVVRVYQNDTLLAQPFIDISDIVNNVRDRGLIGLAVHPNFPTTPYIYLSYVYDPPETQSLTGLAGPDGSGNRVSRVSRFTADASTGYNTVVANSEVVLLGTNSTWENISSPDKDSTGDLTLDPSCGTGGTLQDCLPVDAQSHGVGDIRFGTDGMLFVSNGDGTSYGRVDPRSVRVQDIDSLSGKLLRIDPITGAGKSDNPFYNGNSSANRSKVYSYGLRNPFRFAVNPANGQPYIGDVGWTTWEEINYGEGANFGWPYYEGGNGTSFETGGYRDLAEAQAFYASGASVEPAIWARTHAAGARAIVVGDFYQGDKYTDQLDGALFFTDFGEPTIRAMILDGNGQPVTTETVLGSVGVVVGMTMGPDEYMYYVDIVGRIGRIVKSEGATNPNETPADFIFDATTGTLRITGTPNDDTFAFSMSTPDIITINGIDYTVNVGTTRIEIDGFGGDDTIDVTGTSGDDFTQLYPTSLKYESAGLIVTATSVEDISVTAVAGGADKAYLYDSFRDDIFTGNPTQSTLRGPGYNLTAFGFDEVAAFAVEGYDNATFNGSSGNETYIGRPSYANMTGSDFYYIALAFDATRAYGMGGSDIAAYVDSSGDDVMVIKPTYAYMRVVNSYYNYAQDFDTVNAYASSGGTDSVQIYDSSGNETVSATPTRTSLTSSTGFNTEVNTFEFVYVFSNAGGNDVATFEDSTGNDLFVGRPTNAFLQGPDHFVYVDRFDETTAYSNAGGNDVVQFYDSTGDDIVIAEPTRATIEDNAGTFLHTVWNFESTSSYSTKGGTDIARLYDSSGNDIYVARPEFAFLQGTNFYNYTSGFYTAAYADNGGTDAAQLYDSPIDDFFVSRSNVAWMRDAATTYSNSAYNFDTVDAYSTRGGTDEAQFYDSVADDTLRAQPTNVIMEFGASAGGATHSSNSFARNRAFRTQSGVDRIFQSSGLAYLFEKIGNWDVFSA